MFWFNMSNDCSITISKQYLAAYFAFEKSVNIPGFIRIFTINSQ